MLKRVMTSQQELHNTSILIAIATTSWNKHYYRTVLWIYLTKILPPRLNLVNNINLEVIVSELNSVVGEPEAENDRDDHDLEVDILHGCFLNYDLYLTFRYQNLAY